MPTDDRYPFDKLSAATVRVTVTTADSAFVPHNPRRISLIVTAPPTNRFSLAFKTTAVLDQGVTMYPTNSPLVISGKDAGVDCKGEIRAISAVGNQVVTYVETIAQ